MEILSNKLLTTAFEASLGCVAVMRRAKRRQRGSRDSYGAPEYYGGNYSCYTRIVRQLERAYIFSALEKRSRVCFINRKEEGQMKYRQSDSFIVPKKVGNATGGKEAIYGDNREGNLYNTQRLDKQENSFRGEKC